MMRGLARDPAHRQQEAAELGEELMLELNRLTPSFLPRALSNFTRDVLGLQTGQGRPSAFEEQLLGQLEATASQTQETQATPQEDQSTAVQVASPRRWVWSLLAMLSIGAGLVVWLLMQAEPSPAKPVAKTQVIAPVKTDASIGDSVDLRQGEMVGREILEGLDLATQEKQTVPPGTTQNKRTPKRTPRVRPKVQGRLRINAEPWANVYWQGKKLGHTPLPRLLLPVGRQKLRFVNPEFGIEKEMEVEVRADRSTKVVVRMLE
jgi:serine/threonine-protein kinase